MMVFCASDAADRAGWERTYSLNWLRENAGLLHGLDPHKVLSAMAAMPAYEKTSILAPGVLAATNRPLLLKLTLGTWVVRPFKRFRHCGSEV